MPDHDHLATEVGAHLEGVVQFGLHHELIRRLPHGAALLQSCLELPEGAVLDAMLLQQERPHRLQAEACVVRQQELELRVELPCDAVHAVAGLTERLSEPLRLSLLHRATALQRVGA